MPFLTEEIWSLLPQTTGYVTTAPYPKAEDFEADAAVLDRVAELQEVVTEVRRVRGEMEVAYKVPMKGLAADAALVERMAPIAAGLKHLGNLELDALVGERPKGVATIVVRGVEILIPLEGIVDIAEEVKRLEKVLGRVEKDVNQLRRRLGNPKFVDRAPEEVVAEVRDKLAKAEARQATLVASRDRLAEAL